MSTKLFVRARQEKYFKATSGNGSDSQVATTLNSDPNKGESPSNKKGSKQVIMKKPYPFTLRGSPNIFNKGPVPVRHW